ncbi:MAG: hypothetical protein IMZ71_02750 [Chloroflexi bacterium]|nr:hypothetical protein [Chloroflexota bacterium]
MANGSTVKVLPIVLGVLGGIVTVVSVTFAITQAAASANFVEKNARTETTVSALKLDYEEFRRVDERFKGLIIEKLNTTNDLIKEHMRDTR